MPGDVLGHEDTAEKTGTDSALRELVIWVGGGGESKEIIRSLQ